MSKFCEGDRVSVSAKRLGVDSTYAITDATVLDTRDRSVLLEGPNGASEWIGSAYVSHLIYVRVIRFGDISSELTLLDPITKSIDHYFRMLLPDDSRRTLWIRTMPELAAYLATDDVGTHVVLVGHCDKATGHLSLADGSVSPTDLVGAFSGQPRLFLSLACSSGHVSFARPFSQGAACRQLVAPFQAIDGPTAVEACVLLFNNLLLKGRRVHDATRQVNMSLPERVHLRKWSAGTFVTP